SGLEKDAGVSLFADFRSVDANVHRHHGPQGYKTHKEEFLAVMTPSWKHSAILRYLDLGRPFRKGLDVDLTPAGFSRTVGDPFSVGRHLRIPFVGRRT